MNPRDTKSPDPTVPEADHAHKVYPKQFERDDFWSQIKRTVNGKPVSEEDSVQIIRSHPHPVCALIAKPWHVQP